MLKGFYDGCDDPQREVVAQHPQLLQEDPQTIVERAVGRTSWEPSFKEY